MEKKKLVRIKDKQRDMLEFLKNLLGISENAVINLAIVKLYKELS